MELWHFFSSLPPFWAVMGIAIFSFWYYFHRKWQYFENLDIPYIHPSFLNLGTTLTALKDPVGIHTKAKHEHGLVYGTFFMGKPSITVHDPEILRQIFMKQFRNFPVRSRYFAKSNGKEMNEGLVAAEGEKWKRCRSSITPIFSSAKLKQMFGIMNDCTDQMLDELKHQSDQNNSKFKTKQIFGAYSLKGVLSAVFNTHDKNVTAEESEAVKYAKKFFDLKIMRKIPLMLLILCIPALENITSKLNWSVFDGSALAYFKTISLAIMNTRKKYPNKSKIIDVMQMMIDLQTAGENVKDIHSGKGLTKTEIIGNAMLMIVAGYENTANTLGYLAYNLAMHPNVQDTLQKEVDEAADENGDISYEALQGMEYLEMCLNESLRLYTPFIRNGRVCTKDTTIKGVPFKKDMFVHIPTFTIHRDPEHWEEPNQFNPKRMSDMTAIDPMLFQPFGHGPRNCIAMRFAKIEIKLAIAKLLTKYTLKPSPSTQKPPLNLSFKTTVTPKDPLILTIEKRTKC